MEFSFKIIVKKMKTTPNSHNGRGSQPLSQQISLDYFSHTQSRTGDKRGLSFNVPQSGRIYSSFTLTSASCLSIASGLFFQNRLSHSRSSVQQSLPAVQSVAPQGWGCWRKPAGWETEGELFYFMPLLFSVSRHISCYLKTFF